MQPPVFPNVAVVGMHFREKEGVSAKAIVSNFIPPVDLDIKREPENPFDSFAIKVIYEGQHIGYIEARQAMFISPWIDEGVEYFCTVTDLETRGKNLHPIVTLTPPSAIEIKTESEENVEA